MARPFAITGVVYRALEVAVVELSDGEFVGRGEAAGVDFLGEDIDSVVAAIEDTLVDVRSGARRTDLPELLPGGGARNALDCAFWDLECKQAGRRAWDVAGTTARPVETVYTVGIDVPEAMARDAQAAKAHKALKIKLNSDGALSRLRAVRDARPDARLIVDANQGWSFALLDELAPDLMRLGVEMIEQPLPRGEDDQLIGYKSAIPLCADEGCLGREEFQRTAERYQMINIKLDKCGGLTEALALVQAARACGLGLMVGNMIGTSLAMAPAFLIAQQCEYVDLDGPLLLKHDRAGGMTYVNGWIQPPAAALWG